MESFDFKGCNVLLTGGTGEIGRGFIRSLGSRGVGKIFVPGSYQPRLDSLDADFPELKIIPILADLKDEMGLDLLINRLNSLLNGELLHLVIFNAGSLGLNSGDSYPSWKNALNALVLNVLTPEFCFRKLVKTKLLSDSACILAAGSIAGHRSYANSKNISPYAISKAGLHRAVMNWAIDYPSMTIFELAFGAVQTKMLDSCRPPQMSKLEWNDTLMEDIPIKEVVQPTILAETVISLLDSPGYRLFHGDTVYLSGGERNA